MIKLRTRTSSATAIYPVYLVDALRKQALVRSPFNDVIRAEVTNSGKTGAIAQLLLNASPDEATPPTQTKPCKYKSAHIKNYYHLFTRFVE